MNGWSLSSVLLAATAAGLVSGGNPAALVRRRVRGPAASTPGRGPLGRSSLPGHLAPAVVALAVIAVWGPRLLLVAVTLALVVAAAMRLAAARRARDRAAAQRRELVEVCDALAAEMRAGQPAGRALGRVAAEHALLNPAAQVAGLGGDVAGALDRIAVTPGARGARMIAAAWRVADRSGAGLALVLDRVARALRAEQAAAAEISASLAPPRATARMLAVLPVLGLVLGGSIGGDPVGFLLGTIAGNLCLLGGCALAVAGLWWVERLAASVER